MSRVRSRTETKMSNLVKDEGPKNARIILIGEAPGKAEDVQKRPFIGPSYWQKLEPWWQEVGLDRKQFYITNLYPMRPPNNIIDLIDKNDLAYWKDDLHNRIADLDDPWVIVPTGNYALEALTGKKSILKHRGSIYEYTDRRGRKLKVIPTVHPAATFRQSRLAKHCIQDWRRIANDLTFRELRIPDRETLTAPNLDDLKWYAREHDDSHNAPLAIDIETPGYNIACVGFSFDPSFALVCPTTIEYWGSRKKQLEAIMWVKSMCASPAPKILQNGLFDLYWLKRYQQWNIDVVNYQYDLLAMHHAIDPGDDHDLAYLCSVYTRQPFYKDEAKDPDEIRKYSSNWDALMRYNGLDCVVERECFDSLYAELDELNLVDFYHRHYASLFYPLLHIMLGGIRVSERERVKRATQLQIDCFKLQDELRAVTDTELFGPKAISGKKLKAYLYDTLKLPKQQRVRKKAGEKVKTDSVDEVAIRRLLNAYTAKRIPPTKVPEVEAARKQFPKAANLIMDHRRKSQLGTFYADKRVDDDGYYRSTYSVNTEQGRLNSSRNPMGTGANAQNIDREARAMFVADHGHVLLEVDGSQVESKICYALTGEPELIRRAKLPPWEYDDHTMNAKIIFNRADIDKDQRYLAKRAVHASQRGMMGDKLSDLLLKDGYTREPGECQLMIDRYLDSAPNDAIRNWFRKVRMAIMRNRMLANSWGRVIDFRYDRLDDELYRRGYSFMLQSECADWLNQWGLVPLWNCISVVNDVRIAAQIHDALLISVVPEKAFAVYQLLQAALEQPRRYGTVELTIPAIPKLGRNWSEMVEFKKPPTEKEFTEVAHERVNKE